MVVKEIKWPKLYFEHIPKTTPRFKFRLSKGKKIVEKVRIK